MRNIAETQINMFNKSIEDIKLDIYCRDEIPSILLGLQELYRHQNVLGRILSTLKGIFPEEINRNRGRPGLNLWQILVLGVIRLSCNCDYDKLSDLAGNHNTLRLFLHNGADSEKRYPRQTLIDNISLLTPELLSIVNDEIVNLGYSICGNSKPEECRIDSFVVETNVHFPTDLSLAWDGIRTLIRLCSIRAIHFKLSGWREHKSLSQKLKRLRRECQLVRKGSPKKEKTKAIKKQEEIRTVTKFVREVSTLLLKANNTLLELKEAGESQSNINDIQFFIDKTMHQLNLLSRRIINDERIPHCEKIHSLFEPHTEWISKGKAGKSQELGVRVAIAEDEFGFLVGWRTMFNQTDEKVTIPMVKEILKKHPSVNMCSFDKGFYSRENKVQLAELVEFPILPKKGAISAKEKVMIHKPEYRKYRNKHSRIESAVNAIENHGLDRCHDHGEDGFTRYVALAVVARNILQIGRLVMQQRINIVQREHKKAS